MLDFPYFVDPLDHAESPLNAYVHIKPILTYIARTLHKKPEQLIIYDPYYCDGQVKNHLSSLGFLTVINEKRDFYKYPIPEYDVLVTNPPYSGDHPERLMRFCIERKKPWFILAPNWLYMKPYYSISTSHLPLNPILLVPHKRYVYVTPKGLRTKADDGKTAPFVTLWFCWASFSLYEAAINSAGEFKACRSPAELPMTAMDQYDPEYKRLRNRMKSEKRRKPPQPSKGSWGHKAGVKTNPAGHIRK